MPLRARNVIAFCLRLLQKLYVYKVVYRSIFRVARYARSEPAWRLAGCLLLTGVTALLWGTIIWFVWRLIH